MGKVPKHILRGKRKRKKEEGKQDEKQSRSRHHVGPSDQRARRGKLRGERPCLPKRSDEWGTLDPGDKEKQAWGQEEENLILLGGRTLSLAAPCAD